MPPSRTTKTETSTIHLSDTSYLTKGQIPPSAHPNFESLWQIHPSHLGKIKLFGKLLNTPRWHQSYLKPYSFSGLDHDALPLPPILQPLLNWANHNASEGHIYNQVLVNWYQDGNHYIGPHSDDEKPIVGGSPIFSASFGQERVFRIRRKKGGFRKDLTLEDGSFVVMGGEMQKEFTHEVVKVGGKKGSALGRRINVTFRVFR